MSNSIGEKKLIYRVTHEHDPVAFGELYDSYVAKIYRFIFFKVATKEEAEDLTSDVFLKTWRYLTGEEGRKIQSLSGLIYRVARNCLVDFYRAKSQRAEQPLNLANEYGMDEARYKLVAVEMEAASILQVLKKMKHEYQEVLLLRYIEELSIREMAEILDKSAVSVRVTLHRALKVAKNILGQKYA